jgi:hypothetical protein
MLGLDVPSETSSNNESVGVADDDESVADI